MDVKGNVYKDNDKNKYTHKITGKSDVTKITVPNK